MSRFPAFPHALERLLILVPLALVACGSNDSAETKRHFCTKFRQTELALVGTARYTPLVVKPVASLEEAVRLLAELENEIRALGVTRLALFGSVLRGEATAESDVDALVEFENGQKDFDSFMALAELLEATLGRPVDLVTIQSLSPHIGPHILKTASDVLRAA